MLVEKAPDSFKEAMREAAVDSASGRFAAASQSIREVPNPTGPTVVSVPPLERKMQLRRLLASDPMFGFNDRIPVVVAGDFNDLWGTLGGSVLRPAGFEGRKPQPTFPAYAPVRALDSVYVRGAVALHRLARSRLKVAKQASDHLPLIADLALTGRAMDASEALRHGVVSRVVPDAELDEVSRSVCLEIAANPPFAVKMFRRTMARVAHPLVQRTMQEESMAMTAIYETEDYAELKAARSEGRTPEYRGR